MTTPTPPPFSFYRPDALPAAQPTASKALKANLLHGTKKSGGKEKLRSKNEYAEKHQ